MKSDALPNPAPRRGPTLHPADWVVQAGAVADVLGEMEVQLRRRRRRIATSVSTIAAACLAVTLWVVPYARDTATVTTPLAQRQTLDLADGSRAELNAQTKIHTDFRYGRRLVRLERGEAFFSVAKDEAHPFFVETPAGTVRVTGTQFNVRLTADHGPEVTLLEGSVWMENSVTEPVKLAPGQQFDPTRSSIRALSAIQKDSVVAWRQGRAVFDGDSLADAVARFAGYHGVTITVAPKVAPLRLGGSYPLDQLAEFLDALETMLPVRVQRQTDASVEIVPR